MKARRQQVGRYMNKKKKIINKFLFWIHSKLNKRPCKVCWNIGEYQCAFCRTIPEKDYGEAMGILKIDLPIKLEIGRAHV